jgi:iron-sulfur cluster repair protein YtfE (RIC family)
MAIQPITPMDCEQIRHEHREICELVTTLYRVLAERHEPPNRVMHLLEQLTERVGAHFRDEEEAGLFRDVERRLPQRANEIAKLREEHHDLAARLEWLNQLAAGDYTHECWDELERAFREFGTVLGQHEACENALLQRAYNEDIGERD